MSMTTLIIAFIFQSILKAISGDNKTDRRKGKRTSAAKRKSKRKNYWFKLGIIKGKRG